MPEVIACVVITFNAEVIPHVPEVLALIGKVIAPVLEMIINPYV